jgi:hypothetical protein
MGGDYRYVFQGTFGPVGVDRLGHEIVENFPTGKAPATVHCSEHNLEAKRIFEPPIFQEDRLRFYQAKPNAPSPRWSYALGQDMPESKQERRRLEKEKGIEFVSRDEKPSIPEPPKGPEKGWLKRAFDAKGIRLGDYGGFRPMTREESERKLAAERPDWVESEAVIPK